ncbi:hypothetical protein [Candidatus Endomicrobiellum agilis]|uniref:hypothetical protein n=1 Tax=Candidatus Endomicrobiellum agilis TaxID=3238957 RepID=UPI0035847417|nr:hypothetical protein [Endomicrobium sp.]
MKKAISGVLTLLLISGCVAPPRQLSKSDAVTNVTDLVQTEPLQEAPAITSYIKASNPKNEVKIYNTNYSWFDVACCASVIFNFVCVVYCIYRSEREVERSRREVECSEREAECTIACRRERWRSQVEEQKRHAGDQVNHPGYRIGSSKD